MLPKNYISIYPEKKQGHGYHFMRFPENQPKDDMDGINYQLDMAKLIIDYGADLEAKNLKNETSLAIAMRNKNHHLVALLIKAGSKFWVDVDNNGNTFLHYFAKLASRINSVRPHGFADEELRKKRFIDVIQDIWQAVQVVIQEKRIDFKEIVNLCYSFDIDTFGTKHFLIDQQT